MCLTTRTNVPDISSATNDCSSGLSTDPQQHNYVYTIAYQEAMDTPLTDFTADDRLLQTITFYDGLGRTMQQVNMDGSPDGHDILGYTEYDAYGRAEKEYLPFVDGYRDHGRLPYLTGLRQRPRPITIRPSTAIPPIRMHRNSLRPRP